MLLQLLHQRNKIGSKVGLKFPPSNTFGTLVTSLPTGQGIVLDPPIGGELTARPSGFTPPLVHELTEEGLFKASFGAAKPCKAKFKSTDGVRIIDTGRGMNKPSITSGMFATAIELLISLRLGPRTSLLLETG